MSCKEELSLNPNPRLRVKKELVSSYLEVLEAPGQEEYIILVNFSLPMKAKVLGFPPADREKKTGVARRGSFQREHRKLEK